MLELRPGCECCDRDLPPASADARICSYECTFCADCAETVLKGICPQLRRQSCRSPDPARFNAGAPSRIGQAHRQKGRLSFAGGLTDAILEG
jgi:uncharacterized protein